MARNQHYDPNQPYQVLTIRSYIFVFPQPDHGTRRHETGQVLSHGFAGKVGGQHLLALRRCLLYEALNARSVSKQENVTRKLTLCFEHVLKIFLHNQR